MCFATSARLAQLFPVGFLGLSNISPAYCGCTRVQHEEAPMAQKVIEVVGSSKEGFAKAAENAVAEAGLANTQLILGVTRWPEPSRTWKR
jgi:hypothetical protein